MAVMLGAVVAFLSGALMFSYWLGLFLKINLRSVGDGNPGALNLWRAAGFQWGLAGIVLDFSKGYVPVALLIGSGVVSGYGILVLAFAPIVGHAFSPFLKFKGGKAIAVTFGVWSAVTGFRLSFVYAVILAIFQIIARLIHKKKLASNQADSFHTTLGMGLIFLYAYMRGFPGYIVWLGLGNFLLLIGSNRKELLGISRGWVKKHRETGDSHTV